MLQHSCFTVHQQREWGCSDLSESFERLGDLGKCVLSLTLAELVVVGRASGALDLWHLELGAMWATLESGYKSRLGCLVWTPGSGQLIAATGVTKPRDYRM